MSVREIVILSGKGGTGKTSLTASFAVLASGAPEGGAVLADCDVDAADLHLLLQPSAQTSDVFRAGHEAKIGQDNCVHCGQCASVCRFGAVKTVGDPCDQVYEVDPLACEGCGVCVHACPVGAIQFPEAECGSWSVSQTRAGSMVHARLNPGGENSGKLVTLVRDHARRLAEEQSRDMVIVDGPPGIGCPVIASLGGATRVLVVTEPTVSGEHDLERVLQLAKHFRVPAAVCINKWDINPGQTERIETLSQKHGAELAGRVRYSPAFSSALRRGKTVVELAAEAEDYASEAAEIRLVWEMLISGL